ncbi:Tuberous sclerosis 2-like protein [Balamuthia mandrillaris]
MSQSITLDIAHHKLKLEGEMLLHSCSELLHSPSTEPALCITSDPLSLLPRSTSPDSLGGFASHALSISPPVHSSLLHLEHQPTTMATPHTGKEPYQATTAKEAKRHTSKRKKDKIKKKRRQHSTAMILKNTKASSSRLQSPTGTMEDFATSLELDMFTPPPTIDIKQPGSDGTSADSQEVATKRDAFEPAADTNEQVAEGSTSMLRDSITISAPQYVLANDITHFDAHPSFVFSQLRNIPFMNCAPTALSNGESLQRALLVFDKTPYVQTVKIGVVYVGHGQTTEDEILGNTHGSPRYSKFLKRLGSTKRLKNTTFYSGGLDTRNDTDGEYSLTWSNKVTQVMFHVATLIPNRPSLYPHFENKKRHIGNDNVHIIFNDSGESYQHDTIKGQFNFVHIILSPLSNGMFRVEVKKKKEVPSFGPLQRIQLVSESALVPLVHLLAQSANFGVTRLHDPDMAHTSNLEERLRQIKRINERFKE